MISHYFNHQWNGWHIITWSHGTNSKIHFPNHEMKSIDILQFHGIPWNSKELTRNYMEFHGTSQLYGDFTEFHGIPWNFGVRANFHGFCLNSGIQGVGIPWNSMELHSMWCWRSIKFHGTSLHETGPVQWIFSQHCGYWYTLTPGHW